MKINNPVTVKFSYTPYKFFIQGNKAATWLLNSFNSDVASFAWYDSHGKSKKIFLLEEEQKPQINTEGTSALQGLSQHSTWSVALWKVCLTTPAELLASTEGSSSWHELLCHLLKCHRESWPNHILPCWQNYVLPLEGLLKQVFCQAKSKLKSP